MVDLIDRLKAKLYPFLRIERICRIVFKVRFIYFVKIRRNVRRHPENSGVLAEDYSLRMLLNGRTSNRPLRLIRPLLAIDRVKRSGDVLSVGCRFELELLYLTGYGFKPDKIRGLDMISYSPWVDLGNMHAMPYPDNRWDVILLGWVISYSDQPEVAAREVIRVCRNGAIAAIGVSYYPMEMLMEEKRKGTCVGEPESRKQTVAALLDLFAGHVEEVYFTHEAPDKNVQGMCTVIFSIRK